MCFYFVKTHGRQKYKILLLIISGEGFFR